MYGSFVVPPVLANTVDYKAWTQKNDVPSTIAVTLRSCSTLVLDATQGAIYDVDPATGIATDIAVREALRDATCIQASAWVALNIDPATGGVLQSSKAVTSKKLGSAAFDYSPAEIQSATRARAAAYSSLVPEAVRYLQQRNLYAPAPMVFG